MCSSIVSGGAGENGGSEGHARGQALERSESLNVNWRNATGILYLEAIEEGSKMSAATC